MAVPKYTPNLVVPGSEFDAVFYNNIIDGLTGNNQNPAYTMPELLFTTGVLAGTGASSYTITAPPVWNSYMFLIDGWSTQNAAHDELLMQFNAVTDFSVYSTASIAAAGSGPPARYGNANSGIQLTGDFTAALSTSHFSTICFGLVTGAADFTLAPPQVSSLVSAWFGTVPTALTGSVIGAYGGNNTFTSITFALTSGSFGTGSVLSVYGMS